MDTNNITKEMLSFKIMQEFKDHVQYNRFMYACCINREIGKKGCDGPGQVNKVNKREGKRARGREGERKERRKRKNEWCLLPQEQLVKKKKSGLSQR